MLAPAERRLVDADTALPGLAVLLDENRLTTWLMAAEPRVESVQRSYVRYKRGTSCVLGVGLVVHGQEQVATVVAVGAEGASKLVKTASRAPEGSVLGVDPGLLLLATTPAADRDLPALAVLADQRRRLRALRRLLPGLDLRRHHLSTLSHKPHRRWVGRLTTEGGHDLVLRAYPRDEVGLRVAAVAALADRRPPTPSILGVDPRLGLVAVEYMAGTPLDERLGGTRAGCAHLAAAGAALATLHDRDRGSMPLPVRTSSAEGAAVVAATEAVCDLVPDLAADVLALGREVAGLMHVETCPDSRPLHGDFSIDQVVIGPSGEVALIDLDSGGIGDPAVDLACATAALAADTTMGGDPDVERRRLRALLDGYAAVRPLPPERRLAVHTAAHLLRRAVDPFRLCRQEWPLGVRALVGRADAALQGASVTGGTL